MLTDKLIMAAAGNAGNAGNPVNVEDVFSTFLYEGNASSRTITNGIDLTGQGGMVWIKNRSFTDGNLVFDTERGATDSLLTNKPDEEDTANSSQLNGFNSDGFDLGGGNVVNRNGDNFASWTFRKAPGFFDVVTYTGDGTAGRTIAHSLGSAPGMIWVKRLEVSQDWQVYHRSQGATKYGVLNSNAALGTATNRWNDTEPTGSVFTVGNDNGVNGSGSSYVAYIFAHDDARFGPNGDESIIKCDTYTGNGDSVGTIVDVGFRPQLVFLKRTDGVNDWSVFDRERGASMVNDYGAVLRASQADVEGIADYINFTDTGFQLVRGGGIVNNGSSPYVYMAIKDVYPDPADGTDVLYLNSRAGDGSNTTSNLGFYGSTVWTKRRDGTSSSWIVNGRSIGKSHWHFDNNDLPTSNSRVNFVEAQTNQLAISSNDEVNNSGDNFIDYILKRAKGAYTEFSYIGTGSSTSIPHALGAVPQLWIVKRLTTNTNNPTVGSMFLSLDDFLETNDDSSTTTNSNRWGGSRPTSTGLAVGTHNSTNGSGDFYHAMLFGNVSGVVDVGTYTGTGSAGLQIDCGFTAGARFVLIKCTTLNATSWHVYDTARGITTTTSPELYLDLNITEDASLDRIDPYSSGFEIDSASDDLNGLNETYLYLAIA